MSIKRFPLLACRRPNMWAKRIIILLVLPVLAACASQQDVIALNNRIVQMEKRNLALEGNEKRLQERIKEFSKSRSGKDQQLRSQSADLRATLESIKRDIGVLSGKIEETEYLLQQKLSGSESAGNQLEAAVKRMEGLVAANQMRIAQLEKYLSLEPSAAAAQSPGASAPGHQAGSENELYTLAKQKLSEGDLETSRRHFEEFISKYPKSGFADNSRFWIGEIYFQENWYEKAILEYQTVIEKYPKGNKVPAALLKQGLAFHRLEDKPNARLILKELIRKYPGSNEAKIAKQKLKEFK